MEITKIFMIVFGIIAAICSGIVAKFTPYVAVVLVVLELMNITTYGIGTILLYSTVIWVSAIILVFLNALLIAMASHK